MKTANGLPPVRTFPGGRLDPDETDPLSALHREVHEELSVDIDVLGQLGVFYSRSGLDYTIYAYI